MTMTANVQHLATQLIALHGLEAKAYAATKADEMLKAGNLYERRTWRRVEEAVDEVFARDLLGDFPGLFPHAAPRSQMPRTSIPMSLTSNWIFS
jgi:hypothetical protein